MKAVIDTNVLLVANGQHEEVSTDCVTECVKRLQAIQQKGTVVIDDEFRILREYQNKTSLNPPKGVGDVFLKWLLRNVGGVQVEQIILTETAENCFAEFPDPVLEPVFDGPDRCRIPDDCIDPRRYPLLAARETMRQLVDDLLGRSLLAPGAVS